MSFFLDIQAALDTKLNQLAGGIDVAWENTSYIPTKGTAYLRPSLLMAPSSLLNFESLQMNQGIYQIDLFYPLDRGPGDMLMKADEIHDHFKTDLKLVSNGVSVYLKAISRTTPSEIDEAWFMASIEINFKCYNN